MKVCFRVVNPAVLIAALVLPAIAQQTEGGVPLPQDVPAVRQGASEIRLTDRPQSVLFVKSEATDAKTAIANLLLSDAGLSLITMALAPQMAVWNPYMNDSIRKGVELGRGILAGHGIDTKGFEYDTLAGDTADITLRGGSSAEFVLPVRNYLPAAGFDVDRIRPLLLKLEPRNRDHARLLCSRQVILKQNKTGRFDLKPTVERQEARVDQNPVPISVERLPGDVFKVVPKEPLAPGEYAIVFRTESASGGGTQNVALKPTPRSSSGAVDRVSPGRPALGASRFGMLRGGFKPAAPALTEPVVQTGMAGFLAWDFRVISQ